MKSLKIVMIAILIFLICQNTLISQNIGTTGATFLKLGAGARPIGMGSAFTGLSDDVNAIYWNPAGLGFIKRWELSFTYQKLFADFDYQALFYSHQLRLLHSRKAALGAGLIRLGARENWDSTNGQMPAITADDVADFALIVPFAYRFDWLSQNLAMGINYKYINSRLGDYTSQAHGIDFGLMFKTELFDRLFFSFGTTLQNLTLIKVKFIDDSELLPLIFRTGSAIKFYLTDNQDITLAYDLYRPQDNTIKHCMGIEYWLHLGLHRFGFRGGYRLIDDDLGKLSFSIGYGLDITPLSQNSYFSEMDYGLNNYDTDILGNTNLLSLTLKPNNPEPFKRLLPEYDAKYTSRAEWLLTWENSYDYDDHDRVEYLVVLDTSFSKIDSINTNAKKIINGLKKNSLSANVVFKLLTPATSTRFHFADNSDAQIFYWTVIAFDRNVNITIATGSDKIGKFSNKNLPDIKPIALNFTAATQFDTSKFQGVLEAKIIGLVKKPCRVVIYDSTDSKIICSDIVPQLASSDTFTLQGKWTAEKLGKHRIAAIADFENSIGERDEANNILSHLVPTIPYGWISVIDTTKLEELSYEHIELPTIPYIFFEPNSVEFSMKSIVSNETDPDSLLKLFGTRLRLDYPGLKITIRGFVDPRSEQSTSENIRLSFLRAQKVKQRLVEFGARESQIVILQDHNDSEPRLERKSTIIDPVDQEMVSEENRRAEIRLPDNLPPIKKVEYEKRFFAPRLITRQKNEILSEKIAFNCLFHSSVPVRQLTIFIKDYQNDPFPIKVIPIDTLTADRIVKFILHWDGIKDNDQMIAFNKTYYFSTDVVDSGGKKFDSRMKKFYVGRDVIVKEKRIFALAKFNKVDPLHQFYIEQLDQIEDMMKLDDRIKIRFYGHTDVIGTQERNNILSADRAMELSSWLARLIDFDYRLTDSLKLQLKSRIDNPFSPDNPNIEAKFNFGKGENFPLVAKNIEYGNNGAPQGRTLNRRVDIEVYRISEMKKPLLIVEKNITFHPWCNYLVSQPPTMSRIESIRAPKFGHRSFHLQGEPVFEKPILIASTEIFAVPDNAYLMNDLSFEFQDTTKALLPKVDSLKFKSILTTKDTLASQASTVKTENLIGNQQPMEPTKIIPALINEVTCIELQDSVLWIGTENGLLKWNVYADTFKVIGLDLWKYKRITSLKYDPVEKCLWVGTLKGLRRLVKDEWIADYHVGTGLSGNLINTIFRDLSGRLLVGTNEGINLRDKDGWRVLANMNNGLTDDHVSFIYEDTDSVLWACTNHGVCRQISGGTWVPFEENVHLICDTVRCMIIDNVGNKWFGTAEGLCQFDSQNRLKNFMTFEMADRVKTGKILAIQKDQSGILWCATEDGLAIYKDATWYTYNYNDGLPANFVSSICIQDNSKKYVGFQGGGISILRMP